MNYSERQLAAICAKGNVIVSAAAGAGKTSVLTERVFRLVQEGTPIDRMLILTFTRAAAAEMKTRIAGRLEAAARNAQGDAELRYLRSQAQLCASANISTMHAFCSKVVFRHFYRVGLTPSSKTMDETESAILQREVRERILTEYASEHPEAYRDLIGGFNGENTLISMMNKLYDFLSAEPYPEAWLKHTEASFNDPDAFSSILEAEFSLDKNELNRSLAQLAVLRNRLPLSCEKALAMLDDILLRGRGALLQVCRDDYLCALRSIQGGNLSFPKDLSSSEKDPVKKAKSETMKLIREHIDRYSIAPDKLLETQRDGARLVSRLFSLMRTFLNAYAEEKRQRAVLDFNDLEHMTIEILKDEQISAEYRERFLYVVVDEYQDSNRVQEAILSRVSRSGNLFFVGDVKQSIYRFRKAEPKLFLEKCKTFSGEAGTRINLMENYRSSKAIIDAVNLVFRTVMKEDIAEINYDENAMLYHKSPDSGGKVECHIFERKTAQEEESIEDAEAEARFIADHLIQRMQKPITDTETGGVRQLQYRDVAILLRTRTHAAVFAEALAFAGIPCYAQISGGYFDAIEVQLVLNVLRVLDNRRQDIPLLSVLRSPFFEFTDEELITLRTAHKKGRLLDCLLNAEEKNEHVRETLARLDFWRNLARRVSMERLLDTVLDSVQFREKMGSLPGGIQRIMNLNALIERARAFDLSGSGGVHSFLDMMDNAAAAADVGASQSVTANVVRIMTVHKSKGLEFPIVYLANLGKQFNRKDEKDSLLLHEQYGVGLRYLDSDGVKQQTYSRRLIRQLISNASWAEELRVLYVGMTRAKTELYLLGCVSNVEDSLDTLPEPTLSYLRSADNSMRLLMLSLNGSEISLMVHKKSRTAEQDGSIAAPAIPPVDSSELDFLKHYLDWSYPYPPAARIPAKTTVTDLESDTLDPFYEMSFFDESSAAQIGSRVHAILEHLPMKPVLPEELEQMTTLYGGLPASHRSSLLWYIGTDLHSRCIRSPRVEREWSFVLSLPANELFGTDQSDPVLLQGIIDACFLENNAWILLDYKTDHVENDPAAHAERHRKQISLYAKALHTLTGIPVREAYIVLLNARTAVRMF